MDLDAPLPALALDAQRNLLRCAALAILWAPSARERTRRWMRYREMLSDDRLGGRDGGRG